MSLGKNIYQLRKEKGLSQEELAYQCNVTRQTISKWEADEVMPDTSNLITLSKLFDRTIDDLINNTITSQKPDMFEKTINMIKKHWMKGGYYLCFQGGIVTLFGFVTKIILNEFFKPFDPFGTGDPFGQIKITGQNIFNIFANFILIIGIVMLIGGIILLIFDRKKQKGNKI